MTEQSTQCKRFVFHRESSSQELNHLSDSY